MFTVDSPPFHAGELLAQSRAGGGPRGAAIRGFMPDQHRDFFALLPYVLVAGAGDDGWPIATMLTGEPGFAHSPDPGTLRIDAVPDASDPAAGMLSAGREVGVLGIDFATRRRNRANGAITAADDRGFAIRVRQSFGNCPRYIQRRIVHRTAATPGSTAALVTLDGEARRLIEEADTFFVATASGPAEGARGGVDMSHRGGRPGFVRVAGDRLTIPDFNGNRYFNTLGNLVDEPRASLLFVDFERGDLLELQGVAEIDWRDASRAIEGGERSWRFSVVRAWRRRSALPLRWSFLDYSPVTLGTGTWR
jgi:uncharacterized protein